jgi:hypothetical protein
MPDRRRHRQHTEIKNENKERRAQRGPDTETKRREIRKHRRTYLHYCEPGRGTGETDRHRGREKWTTRGNNFSFFGWRKSGEKKLAAAAAFFY